MIRRYENLIIKANKRKSDIFFLTKYLNIGLCPDYFKLKPPENEYFEYSSDLHSLVVNKARKTTENQLIEIKLKLLK